MEGWHKKVKRQLGKKVKGKSNAVNRTVVLPKWHYYQLILAGC